MLLLGRRNKATSGNYDLNGHEPLSLSLALFRAAFSRVADMNDARAPRDDPSRVFHLRDFLHRIARESMVNRFRVTNRSSRNGGLTNNPIVRDLSRHYEPTR